MIYGVVGVPGAGKSLWLTHVALEALLGGRDVYTNYRLRWKHVLWYAYRRGVRPKPGDDGWRGVSRALGRWRVVRTYEDLERVEEGLLCFDEAHIWLWSRAWHELPRSVVSWWSQSRKHGVDVWWASQRLGAVDAHVRELTAEIYYARRILRTGWFLLQAEDRESTDRRRRIWGRRLLRLDPWLYACYDTREVMEPPYVERYRERARGAGALRRPPRPASGHYGRPRPPSPSGRSEAEQARSALTAARGRP